MWAVSPTRIAFVLFASCVATPVLTWGQSPTPALADIVSRVEQAQIASHDHDVAYQMTREYQLSTPGAQTPSSNVVAQVSFVPPGTKDYTIVKAEGSSRGESIVRKVLEHEAQMASHVEQHEVSRQNYDFALLGREIIDGHDCYVLQLTPKRQTAELMRGKAWIDTSDFTIRRMAGAPAKSPTIWIRNLTVTINYGDVSGVRVATSTRAVADLRFVGTHILTSKAIELRTGEVDARNQYPSRKSAPRSDPRHAAAGTAVWVAR